MSAAEPPVLSWSDLPVERLPLTPFELDLGATLAGGQAFQWRQSGDAWYGVVREQALRIWQSDGTTPYQAFPGPADFLSDYFRADVDLGRWANQTMAADPTVAKALFEYPGLRVLAQDSSETLLSFVAASASNVKRITRSLRELSRRLGRPIATIDGEHYQAFPTPEAIVAAPIEVTYVACDLRYRARTLAGVAETLVARGPSWLPGLAELPYREANAHLAELRGIGPKIADCVCLFGLRFDEAVPVDVHIQRLARTLFSTEIPTASLTGRTYWLIGDLYRERFGRRAGWAQQYLFHASRMGMLVP